MPVYRNDKRLAKRLLAGDEAAFGQFFDDNFARLYRFVAARVPEDRQAVSEIVHASLHRALRKIHTYRAEAAMFSWLCTICRREIADWMARQQQYRSHIVLIEDRPELQAVFESFGSSNELDPEDSYMRTESVRLIQVALDLLPVRYGDVLEWKYIEGHSVKDIASRLGIGTEAAQSLLARAKRMFADVYASLGASVLRSEGG